MSTTDLLCVGEAFEDLVFLGLPHLPRPGEEIKTSAFHQTIGGGAIITAVAAARLGLSTRVLSALGPEAASRLRRERVGVGNVRRPGEAHAITAALSTRADRSFVTFNGVNDVLEPRLASALPRARARHIHFAFAPRHCGRWLRIVEACRARGIETSWDFGWNPGLVNERRFAALTQALDVLFLNEKEAPLYARRPTLAGALDVWRRHPRAVVVKLGRRGSRYLSATEDVTVPAPRVKAVDTTGAGDAFNGGFLYARLAGLRAALCLRVGNFVGAQSTRRAGGLDGLPDGDDLPAWAR